MRYFELNSKYVMYRREYFGGIISDVRESNFRIVNETAADVIDLVIEGKSYDNILKTMTQIYEQDINLIESDLHDIIRDLLDNKYIIEIDKKPGIGLARNISVPTGTGLSAPIEVNVYPYYSCNQYCKFCYVHPIKSSYIMREAEFDKILKSRGLENVFSYNILGGEPFLNVTMLKHILNVVPCNKKVCISTNGSLKSAQDAIRWLKDYENVWIQVSLESGEPEEHDSIVGLRGAYNNAMMFIELLLSANVRVNVNAVATGDNHKGIIELAKVLKKVGVPVMSVSLCYPQKDYGYMDYICYKSLCDKFNLLSDELATLATDDFEISIIKENLFVAPEIKAQEIEKADIPAEFLECHGSSISIEIVPNGDVYPCGLVIEDKQYLLGNIYSQPFSDI